MPIYTYRCSCGYEADQIRGREVVTSPCPECDGIAERAQVNRFSFSGFTTTPVDQRAVKTKTFLEASAEVDYRHQRAVADGQQPEAPQHYKWAKQEAKRLQSLGVKDSTEVFGNGN